MPRITPVHWTVLEKVILAAGFRFARQEGSHRYRGAFKAKMVREGLRGERTMNEIAADYGVHPVPIIQWKQMA